MPRIRPIALAIAAWLVGVGTAVAVGLLSLSFVGAGLSGGTTDPLAESGLSVEDPNPTPSATPTTSASPSAVAGQSTERSMTSDGGTVVARCDENADAYLLLWSPAPGFHTDDVRRGPARTVHVGFESSTREISVSVTCRGGAPDFVVGRD